MIQVPAVLRILPEGLRVLKQIFVFLRDYELRIPCKLICAGGMGPPVLCKKNDVNSIDTQLPKLFFFKRIAAIDKNSLVLMYQDARIYRAAIYMNIICEFYDKRPLCLSIALRIASMFSPGTRAWTLWAGDRMYPPSLPSTSTNLLISSSIS